MRNFLVFVLLCSALVANADSCPDYQIAATPPTLTGPAKKSFRHFGNTLLSRLYKPWHMVHDQIVAQGQAITVSAKFDYDAVLHKDLEDERVHAYLYGTGMAGWQYLGSAMTNSDGKITLALGTRPVGEYQLRVIVEGDLTSASGYVSVVEPGREAVLFDIDGTLTLNDFEAYADYLGIRNAQPHYYAAETVRAYQAKGYQILYLTARPYWVTRDARQWFPWTQLLPWHYHSNPYGDGPIPPNTQQFKTDYVKYLREQVGLNIVRAYGNATTDIAAYADGGLPKAETWIIGENAGRDGTQNVGPDYSYHYFTVVNNTPQASCRS